MKTRKILALIGALVLLPVVLLAQEVQRENQNAKSSKVSEDYSAYQIDGIVVTSSKLPKTKGNVTQKVDIIDEKQLEERVYGNRNVAEALRLRAWSIRKCAFTKRCKLGVVRRPGVSNLRRVRERAPSASFCSGIRRRLDKRMVTKSASRNATAPME